MATSSRAHQRPISSFLEPGSLAQADSLAVLHLRRDLQIPTLLREQDDENEGYDEGKVTNSRFGSFPHSTLIGVPWGSQILASAVDTGSRGRRIQNDVSAKGLKRKRDLDIAEGSPRTPDTLQEESAFKAAVTASSGFAHLLPPTPESWTSSLPHRTQVVYTPDYSYILQRLRVRPGSQLIEAGAGSGSFTHAAARAVFGSQPDQELETLQSDGHLAATLGKVWSYEFHEQRVEKLKAELADHGLSDIVHVMHRDVCSDGFLVEQPQECFVEADAIFLDLPAPWLALEHLTRDASTVMNGTSTPFTAVGEDLVNSQSTAAKVASKQRPVLNLHATVRVCTFSPCIEQVQRTVTTMRQLGWMEIEMVEIAAKRIDVRRERVGLQEEGLRGVHASAASVDEAMTRLRQLEGVAREAQDIASLEEERGQTRITDAEASRSAWKQGNSIVKKTSSDRKLYKEGTLIHRAEPEIKTHTSYLVFAILPQVWTEEDETAAQETWTSKPDSMEHQGKLSKRQQKRLAKSKGANASPNKQVKKEADGSLITAMDDFED